MSLVEFLRNANGVHLGTLRQDLHEDYGSELKAHIIDSVLDVVAAEHEDAVINVFKAVFIERETRERLEKMIAQGAPGVEGRVTLPAVA